MYTRTNRYIETQYRSRYKKNISLLITNQKNNSGILQTMLCTWTNNMLQFSVETQLFGDTKGSIELHTGFPREEFKCAFRGLPTGKTMSIKFEANPKPMFIKIVNADRKTRKPIGDTKLFVVNHDNFPARAYTRRSRSKKQQKDAISETTTVKRDEEMSVKKPQKRKRSSQQATQQTVKEQIRNKRQKHTQNRQHRRITRKRTCHPPPHPISHSPTIPVRLPVSEDQISDLFAALQGTTTQGVDHVPSVQYPQPTYSWTQQERRHTPIPTDTASSLADLVAFLETPSWKNKKKLLCPGCSPSDYCPTCNFS
jgi:hypothetical protein